ncbi:DUF7848 domain-containing protein [Streptomyces corynorhini]
MSPPPPPDTASYSSLRRMRCSATSGTLHTPDELTRWIAGHCAQSGHELYEQTVRVVRAEPGAWQ